MSKKSNSNPQKSNKGSKSNTSDLSDDSTFWDIESDPSEIDSSSPQLDEIEKILAQNKTGQPLKSMSQQEPVIQIPDEMDVISSLDQHRGSKAIEELPDISGKNVDELLASATAEMKAEQDRDKGIQPTPKLQPSSKKAKDIKSPVEKIAIFVCYLAIIGIFTYLIIYASKQHNFETAKAYEPNTPAHGEYANIEKIETWWSKPMGKNTRFGVILVPSATITLDSESTSGVIRSVFYSSEEGLLGQLKPKGDPYTHEFIDGKFLESGTNQITIYGTDGFDQLAHFLFYKSQDDSRWTLEVKEAPTIKTEVNSFKPLANAPIDPIRK